MPSDNPAQNPGGGRTPATQPDRGDKDSQPAQNQPSHQGNRPDSAQRLINLIEKVVVRSGKSKLGKSHISLGDSLYESGDRYVRSKCKYTNSW